MNNDCSCFVANECETDVKASVIREMTEGRSGADLHSNDFEDTFSILHSKLNTKLNA